MYTLLPWLPTLPDSFANGVHAVTRHATTGLRYVSAHTGVPAVVLAALGVVISYRIARKLLRLFVEVALVLGVLVLATRFGWLSF